MVSVLSDDCAGCASRIAGIGRRGAKVVRCEIEAAIDRLDEAVAMLEGVMEGVDEESMFAVELSAMIGRLRAVVDGLEVLIDE
jgi:hypothetical protein